MFPGGRPLASKHHPWERLAVSSWLVLARGIRTRSQVVQPSMDSASAWTVKLVVTTAPAAVRNWPQIR